MTPSQSTVDSLSVMLAAKTIAKGKRGSHLELIQVIKAANR